LPECLDTSIDRLSANTRVGRALTKGMHRRTSEMKSPNPTKPSSQRSTLAQASETSARERKTWTCARVDLQRRTKMVRAPTANPRRTSTGPSTSKEKLAPVQVRASTISTLDLHRRNPKLGDRKFGVRSPPRNFHECNLIMRAYRSRFRRIEFGGCTLQSSRYIGEMSSLTCPNLAYAHAPNWCIRATTVVRRPKLRTRQYMR